MENGQGKSRVHSVVLTALSLVVAAAVVWVVWQAWDYYATPLAERAHHPDYREFRPAGNVGHGLGILGSAMILLLFIYSLRKRIGFMQRWGHLGTWLRYHIFLGIAGPILITLHTSFKVDGLVAISFWSMAAVALSGVFGRYLYQQIPRNVLGQEMGSGEIEVSNEAILVELSESHGLKDHDTAKIEDLALGPLAGRPALIGLLTLPFANLMLSRRIKHPDPRARDLARTWILQTRRLHLFHQIRDLFHYWHVFHKPFAIIMVLVMIVHVVVAVSLGYTWV
jgi:hypothetical protein